MIIDTITLWSLPQQTTINPLLFTIPTNYEEQYQQKQLITHVHLTALTADGQLFSVTSIKTE